MILNASISLKRESFLDVSFFPLGSKLLFYRVVDLFYLFGQCKAFLFQSEREFSSLLSSWIVNSYVVQFWLAVKLYGKGSGGYYLFFLVVLWFAGFGRWKTLRGCLIVCCFTQFFSFFLDARLDGGGS